MIWKDLIETYDNASETEVITPVAHTKIMGHIGILIDKAGNFKMGMIMNEPIFAPCTIDSETRSSNIAPHVIHDNLSYVASLDGFEERHAEYLHQLRTYAQNSKDVYAESVLEYVKKNTVLDDIEPLISKLPKTLQLKNTNVGFAIYEFPDQPEKNQSWIDYYTESLPKNGICPITGEPDHIPDKYPGQILPYARLAKLFVGKADPMEGMESLLPGYIASQKILHTLQFLCREKTPEDGATRYVTFRKKS